MQAPRKKRKNVCEICGLHTARTDNEKRKFLAKFPLDPNRCKLWVKLTGKEDLAYIPIEKLHQLKYLCGDHFKPKDFNKKKNRLKRRAIPSENLRAEPLSDEILQAFPLRIYVDKENILCRPNMDEEKISRDELKVPGEEVTNNPIPCIESYSENILCPNKAENKFLEKVGAGQMPVSDKNALAKIRNNPIASTAEGCPGHVEHDHDYINRVVCDHDYITHSEDSIQICDTKKVIKKDQDIPVAAEVIVEDNLIKTRIWKRKTVIKKKITIKSSEKKIYKKILQNKFTMKELQTQVKVIESSPALQLLLGTAVKNINKKPQGRRYTIIEKGLALSIYKKSPKVYRLLHSLQLSLPNERTLQATLHKLVLEPGIHQTVINSLKGRVTTMKEEDKICAVLFDEMSLKKRAIYNPSTDKVEGFVDLGTEESRKPVLANKALVVMLQGLRQKYKQPVGHFFVEAAITKEELAVVIKTVIRSVNEAGFTVKATVCDQGSNNMGDINLLKTWSNSNNDDNFFKIDDQKIFILYDVPHLFKNIRNNFIQGGQLHWDGRTARVEHLHEVEKKNTQTLHFKKINKIILRPTFKSKMKVKYAAHLLSNTVQAIVRLMGDSEESGSTKQKEMHETADIIKDLDLLFDVTNGPSGPKDVKKGIRENVRKDDFHHKKWEIFKKKLNAAFFSYPNGKRLHVRCLNGYKTTIASLQDIWEYLRSRGIKVMNLRQANQDCLENLFGQVRQHSPTNPNPTCSHFTAALKSCIMTKVCTPSRGANCEPDQGKLLFELLDEPKDHTEHDTNKDAHPNECTCEDLENVPVLHLPEEDMEQTLTDLTEFHMQPTVYVSGFLAKKFWPTSSVLTAKKTSRRKTISRIYTSLFPIENGGLKTILLTHQRSSANL